MKESDVAAKQERDREDWQKRGVGGLVSKVDAASGAITLAAPVIGDAKPITINISKSTIIRRYSPDSVKFDDATPARSIKSMWATNCVRGSSQRGWY